MLHWLDGLIAWSVQRRVIVLLLAAVLVMAGLYSARGAALDVLPDFMPPRVVVQTEAPGMGTTDVEQLVTTPIERVLLSTPNATVVRSTSAPGLSVVTLMFADDLDVYRARQLVTERLQLARQRLPTTVKEPQLSPISAPLGALLKFCITYPGGSPEPARATRAFADWELRPRLLAIPGVAQVTIHGGGVERVVVQLDARRMRAHAVTAAQVADVVRRSQALTGGGFIEETASRIDIQTDARLTLATAAEVLAGSVIDLRDGLPVRLGDVATIVREDMPPIGAAAYDAQPALYVQVTKLPGADTLAVTETVEAVIAELRLRLPAGSHLEAPVFRQAESVERSLHSVGRSMAIGAGLVVLVLMTFLRSPRLAAISLTAIPLSILAAAVVLIAAGATINGMTLGGLAIAVGEVVDDAIVDVENVWRRLRENAQQSTPRPPLEVVRDASREVRGSVVYATVIVCLVLVPVLMLGGIAGRIFSPLAEAYMLAIAASLIVALTVTPAMCAWLLPSIAARPDPPTRVASGLLAGYRRLLGRVVRWPRTVFASVGSLGLGAMIVLPLLGGRFLPEFRERSAIAHVQAVPGSSLAATMGLGLHVDARARPEAATHVAIRAGRAELDDDAAPISRMELDLELPAEDDREWEVILADLAVRIGQVPGVGFVVEGFLSERIHELLSGETAPVVIKIFGADLGELRGTVAAAADIIGTTPGVGYVRVEPQLDVPQLRVQPDPAALARHAVHPLDLADSLVLWRQGRPITQILMPDGRVIDVVVAGPAELRSQAGLKDLPIDLGRGGTLPLAALARIEEAAAPAVVYHEGGERRITIGVGIAGAGLSHTVAELQRRLDTELALPPGTRLEIGGEAVARQEAAIELLVVGAAVLLGIFVLLAGAFSSLRDAGIVLINLPLGLVGGVAAASLMEEGLSVAGFVGFVTLFGIIARNGIMLVAHLRHLEVELPQLDPVARVLRAAEERLLPILMTAATAGLGLLPLALSAGSAGSELEAPMAIIVCGGLLTSTVLNVLVLPTVYVWVARRRRDGHHDA